MITALEANDNPPPRAQTLQPPPKENPSTPSPAPPAETKAPRSAEPGERPPRKSRRIGYAFAGIALAQGILPTAEYGQYLEEL